MKRHGGYAAALLADLLGSVGALLIATRHWQTVTVPRPRPRTAAVLGLTGRDVDAAPTALALVALAGVVAVLATRGPLRRVIGGVLVLAGAGLVWRAIASSGAVSTSRARALVADRLTTVDVGPVQPSVVTHGVWAVSTVGCGVLVAVAGAAVAALGHRWGAMSARHEPPSDEARTGPEQPRAAALLWTALDRGEDPTSSGR